MASRREGVAPSIGVAVGLLVLWGCGDSDGPSDPGPPGTPNQPPVAAFSASESSGPAPLSVTFDGSDSHDPDGGIVVYDWDFGDGTSVAGSSAVVTHVYEGPGYFFPRLTVTDDRGASDTLLDSALVVTAPPGQGEGTISGYVRHDRSGDGVRSDEAEPVVGSVVFLDMDRSGTRTAGEPYTVTDRDGFYAFHGVETGESYAVTQELEIGWTNTWAEAVEIPPSGPPLGISRIIAGTPAAEGDFPFMVGLLRANQTSNPAAFQCGGSFIAARWILTAAHCVSADNMTSTLPPSALHVLVGTTDLNSGGERVAVERIRVFGGFGAGSFAADDVAVLELERDFMIPRVVLHSPDQPHHTAPGTMATAIGWGRTTFGGNISTVLRRVGLPIISNAQCEQMLDEAVVPSTICAGQFGTSESTCSGDSGGPLMTPSGQDWVQVGLTSFGRNCQPPIAFARISEFRDWFRNNVPAEPSMSVEVDWAEGSAVRIDFGNFR